jgi:hypothetical protein
VAGVSAGRGLSHVLVPASRRNIKMQTMLDKQNKSWAEFSTLGEAGKHFNNLVCWAAKRPSLKLKTWPPATSSFLIPGSDATLHDDAFFGALLRLRLLERLQRQLPRRLQLQQLLEQLRHVRPVLGRRLDVLALPHRLKSTKKKRFILSRQPSYSANGHTPCFQGAQKLMDRLHWQHLLANHWQQRHTTVWNSTCLGHLGQCNTDRIISIYVAPPKVAKESKEGAISPAISLALLP